MLLVYLLCMVFPVCTGAFFWVKSKKITWWEWLLAPAIGFIISIIFNYICAKAMTTDYETLSGQIVKTIHYPRWVEEYTEIVCTTVSDGDGNSHIETHLETKRRTNEEYWTAYCSVRKGDLNIDAQMFVHISSKFGGYVAVDGQKSGLISGDPNIYVAENKTGYIVPTTMWRSFENRTLASPSLFSYSKVPKDIKAYPYPNNKNPFTSDRLIGFNNIDIEEFDKMNARLGPISKVNVVFVGFGPKSDSMLAQYQESEYKGGKKNDIVVCYGGGEFVDQPAWVRVFGWTERDIVKRNLETILLNNKVDNSILPLVEQEIRANYQLKDWSKFNYLDIEPPAWAYIVLLLIMTLIQGGYWYWASNNDMDKEDYRKYTR